MADFHEVQEVFHRNGWTDGLPVIPPTPDLVRRFLDAGAIEASAVVGILPERSRTIMAEHVAINAVMAGCLPEHFSVVLAIWRCLAAPEYNLNAAAVSTSGGAPLVIVNGPIVRRLGMRTGANVFGPGNRANATIGRAVRLMIGNLAGITSESDQACLGHPGKYSYCIAEDEDATWLPLHVQRGFEREQSAVTVVHAEGPHHVRESAARRPDSLLLNYVDHIKTWNQGGCGVAVFNAEHRAVIQTAGWTKADVSQFLFDQAVRTVAEMKRTSRLSGPVLEGDETAPYRVARRPEDLFVIGAGGPGVFSAVIPPWGGGMRNRPVSREVEDHLR